MEKNDKINVASPEAHEKPQGFAVHMQFLIGQLITKEALRVHVLLQRCTYSKELVRFR